MKIDFSTSVTTTDVRNAIAQSLVQLEGLYSDAPTRDDRALIDALTRQLSSAYKSLSSLDVSARSLVDRALIDIQNERIERLAKIDVDNDVDLVTSTIVCNDALLVEYVQSTGNYRLRWSIDCLDYTLDVDKRYASLGDALRASAYVVDQMQ